MKNLEKEIIEELGTQIQSEIDKEILWGMLVGMSEFIFENSEDAVNFILKWK